MPAPRKYRQELRERASRLVLEARLAEVLVVDEDGLASGSQQYRAGDRRVHHLESRLVDVHAMEGTAKKLPTGAVEIHVHIDERTLHPDACVDTV